MWFNLALYLKRGPSGGEYNGGGGATSAAAAIEPCLLEVDSWIDSRKTTLWHVEWVNYPQ